MLAKNMGQTDRIIRAIVGAIAIVLFFATSLSWGWVFLLVGAVLLATAALGSCPPYALLGINTCKVKNS